MCANVLLKICEGGEELCATSLITIEGVTCMKSLMCFQPETEIDQLI